MTFQTLINFDKLLEDMDKSHMRDLMDLSRPYWNDWKYSWSLDIAHMNFPFLY